MGIRELKAELQLQEKHALIHHLIEIYKRYPEARQYLDFFVNPDEDLLLENFKSRVYLSFHPEKGRKAKLYKARKAINDFKKLASSPVSVASLLIYFPAVAANFAALNQTGTASHYTRIEQSFRAALEYMDKNDLLHEFEAECNLLCERCQPFPFDCGEHMQAIYNHFF